MFSPKEMIQNVLKPYIAINIILSKVKINGNLNHSKIKKILL